jgi:ribose transport system permease protein
MLRMSELSMLTLAQTLVMIGGGMDLTVGSVMALSGAIAGMLFRAGFNPATVLVCALLGGALVGFLNSFLVVHLKIQSFIATVATNTIIRSVVYLLLKGRVLSAFPKSYVSLGSSYVLGFPILFLAVIAIAVALHLLLRRTALGRSIYAAGANEQCAHISGIHVNYVKYFIFTMSGILSAIGGIMYTMRIGAIIPDAGLNSPLEVVTAVLIGGASVRGGKGSVLGSLLGILAMYVLLNGFSLLGLSSFWEVIMLGVVLIAIVGQGNKKQIVKMSRFSRRKAL